MAGIQEEAGRLLLEASKLAVDAVINVLKEIQKDMKTHKTYEILNLAEIQFLCEFMRPYTGKDSEYIGRFPPELAPHLRAADNSLKELENLLKEAKDLDSWNPLKIIKKLYEAPEFKLAFDTQLKHLQTHWTAFSEAGRKTSSLLAWEEIFLQYPHAGLFWLNIARTETKITYDKFYDEITVHCGGNRKTTLNYPSLFLKGYIYEYMCEIKTNLDSTTMITVHSFKTWVGLSSGGKKELELKSIFGRVLAQLAIESADFESPARKLYQRAKGLLNDAQDTKPPNREQLLESQNLFVAYRLLVDEKVPLLRDPKEDRHLYYLWEIDGLLHPDGVNTTAGPAFQRWQKWSKDHGTQTPKQKAQAAAVNHYYLGEAYIRKVKKLLGEAVEDDKQAEKTWAQLPHYKKTAMNAWEFEDVTKWLEDQKFNDYIPAFTENQVNGQILMDLDDTELKEELKIEKKLHRQRLLKSIKAFSPQPQPLINTLQVEEEDVPWLLQSARAELDLYKNVLGDTSDKKRVKGEKPKGKATPVLGDKSDDYLTEIQRLEQLIAIESLAKLAITKKNKNT